MLRVRRLDARPEPPTSGTVFRSSWDWYATHNSVAAEYTIPEEIIGAGRDVGIRVMAHFDTEAEAIDAVSAACVAHGRRLANLPPLPAPAPEAVRDPIGSAT